MEVRIPILRNTWMKMSIRSVGDRGASFEFKTYYYRHTKTFIFQSYATIENPALKIGILLLVQADLNITWYIPNALLSRYTQRSINRLKNVCIININIYYVSIRNHSGTCDIVSVSAWLSTEFLSLRTVGKFQENLQYFGSHC